MTISESTDRDDGRSGVMLKDASADSACKVFRYEIHESGGNLCIDGERARGRNAAFAEEVFAAFSMDTGIYCDWLQNLVED
jgi:hypothetical protein